MKIFLIIFLIFLNLVQIYPNNLDIGATSIKGSVRRSKTENEDRFITPEKERSDFVYLFAVCDGHNGAGASEYIKQNLETKFYENLRQYDTVQALRISIQETNNEILNNFTRDGSTLTVVVFDPQNGRWIFANVGDSRAILFNLKTKKIRYSTKDHDPYVNKAEYERVKEAEAQFHSYKFGYEKNIFIKDGKVFYDYDPYCKKISLNPNHVGPHTPKPRYISLPDKEGLSMSRCLGGKHLRSAIFIAQPEIEEKEIRPGDCLLILSDGVLNVFPNKSQQWDTYDENKKIRNIIMKKKYKDLDASKVAEKLCNLVVKRTKKNESYRDDATAVVVKFTDEPVTPQEPDNHPLLSESDSPVVSEGKIKQLANMLQQYCCIPL